MISSWSYNPKVAASLSGTNVSCRMSPPSNEKRMYHDSVTNLHEKSPARKKSTLKWFHLEMWQKITKMLSPSEQRLNSLDKTKQSLSMPDIYVDANIVTPVFEATPRKAKLLLPKENNRAISLSLGNSPFWWDPKSENLEQMESLCENSLLVDSCIESNCKTHNKQSKCRISTMGRNEKNLDVLDSDRESESEFYDAVQQTGFEVQQNMSTSPMWFMADCMYFDENLSSIGCSVANVSVTCKFAGSNFERQSSECGSEDSFVIFSEDAPSTTPSASPSKQKDRRVEINDFYNTAPVRRQRQISECSDDSVVFCYESDHEDVCYQGVVDSDDDDFGRRTTENDSTGKRSGSTSSQQLDSGFEEKKVRFNLHPEVHVIRVWDFAYRQARKGEWETAARDRERFKKRIEEIGNILKPVLDCNIRETVFRDRFAS